MISLGGTKVAFFRGVTINAGVSVPLVSQSCISRPFEVRKVVHSNPIHRGEHD